MEFQRPPGASVDVNRKPSWRVSIHKTPVPGIRLPRPPRAETSMHRSSHKFLMTVFALLLVLVATEAVAGGPHYYGSRHYGPRLSHSYYGSYSNYSYYYPARGYAAHVLP